MTTHYAKAKVQLLQLKEELENRVTKIDYDTQHPPQELSEHWDDQALLAGQNEVRQSLSVEAKQELVMINKALNCIENGTYGECRVCGDAINPQRLKAVPYATLCMQHAS